MNRLWLRTESVLSIHELLAEKHGGKLGIRDVEALESVLERPKRLLRGGAGDIPTLAATYAIDIVRDRPMVDRNLRLALAVFGTFLELGDFGLNADRGDILTTFLNLQENEDFDEHFILWARDYATQRTYRGNFRLLNFGGPLRFTNV